MNVSLSPEQANLIKREVKTGFYSSASEVFHEAIRVWHEQRVAKDLAALEQAHQGAFERDTTAAEMTAILRAKKKVREQMKRAAKRK